jgi:hypothetical protein
MGGGTLDSTGTIALIATALILGCFFGSRLIAAKEPSAGRPLGRGGSQTWATRR